MTQKEINLMVQCLRWRMNYDKSHPEVGFATDIGDLLQEICEECDYDLAGDEIAVIIHLYRIRYTRR